MVLKFTPQLVPAISPSRSRPQRAVQDGLKTLTTRFSENTLPKIARKRRYLSRSGAVNIVSIQPWRESFSVEELVHDHKSTQHCPVASLLGATLKAGQGLSLKRRNAFRAEAVWWSMKSQVRSVRIRYFPSLELAAASFSWAAS